LTLGLRIGAAMIFHRRRGALQKNEQCVQSNCCDHSNRDCCAFAHGSGGGRKWFSRGGRARRIWRRSYCGQRARSADGVCRTATARLLRATSSCGLCRSTDAGVCRAGVNGPATSRSSPLTPSAKTGFSWCGLDCSRPLIVAACPPPGALPRAWCRHLNSTFTVARARCPCAPI